MATNFKKELVILTEEEKSKTNGGAKYDFLVTITGEDGGKTEKNLGTIEFKYDSTDCFPYFFEYRRPSSIGEDELGFTLKTLPRILDGGDESSCSDDYRDGGTVTDAEGMTTTTTMRLVGFGDGLDFQRFMGSQSVMYLDLSYVETQAVDNLAKYHDGWRSNISWKLRLIS